MPGEFTSTYQRTKYWLDMLWPDRQKKQQQDDQNREQQSRDLLTEGRLDHDDFENGYRYEPTEDGGFKVQQYPTGRFIGEIRQNDEGLWQTRTQPTAQWQEADTEASADDLEAGRHEASEILEQRHCGEAEAALIQSGVYVDYEAHYSLQTLHNAQNALDQGVSKDAVDEYMRHHADPDAEPNETSVTIAAVPGSSYWNVADPEIRAQILSSSPWAQQQARLQQAQHQQQLWQQAAQQTVQQPQLSSVGPGR